MTLLHFVLSIIFLNGCSSTEKLETSQVHDTISTTKYGDFKELAGDYMMKVLGMPSKELLTFTDEFETALSKMKNDDRELYNRFIDLIGVSYVDMSNNSIKRYNDLKYLSDKLFIFSSFDRILLGIKLINQDTIDDAKFVIFGTKFLKFQFKLKLNRTDSCGVNYLRYDYTFSRVQ